MVLVLDAACLSGRAGRAVALSSVSDVSSLAPCPPTPDRTGPWGRAVGAVATRGGGWQSWLGGPLRHRTVPSSCPCRAWYSFKVARSIGSAARGRAACVCVLFVRASSGGRVDGVVTSPTATSGNIPWFMGVVFCYVRAGWFNFHPPRAGFFPPPSKRPSFCEHPLLLILRNIFHFNFVISTSTATSTYPCPIRLNPLPRLPWWGAGGSTAPPIVGKAQSPAPTRVRSTYMAEQGANLRLLQTFRITSTTAPHWCSNLIIIFNIRRREPGTQVSCVLYGFFAGGNVHLLFRG